MTNPNNPLPYGFGYRQARIGNVGQVTPGVQAPMINQNVIQQVPPQPPQSPQIPQTSGYQSLLQALAAKQAMDQSGRFRDNAQGAFIQRGKGKSALLGGLNAALANRKEDQAYDAMREAARLEADDKELQMEEKRRVLFEYYKSQGMDPDQAAIRAKVEAMGMEAGGKKNIKMSDVNSLQTQINNTIGNDFRQRTDAVRDVTKYAQGKTGFSDHALIFRYMKFLDPNSTVREGEFATVEQTGSLPQQVVVMYNKALKGDKLTDEQRNSVVSAVVGAYPQYVEQFQRDLEPFRVRAQNWDVDWNEISVPKPFDLSPTTDAEQPPEAPPGYRVEKRDGEWVAIPDE